MKKRKKDGIYSVTIINSPTFSILVNGINNKSPRRLAPLT